MDVKYKQYGHLSNTLIFGHSRANLGINDSLIDNTFNYASYGESSVSTYYKLKRILATPDHQVKRIIIPVGLSTFFTYKNPNLMDHSYWNRYIDYTELGAYQKDRATYYSVYLQSKVVPYGKMIIQEINRKMPNFKKGKSELSELDTEKEKYDFAIESVENHFNDRNYYDKTSFIYLNMLLQLCQKNNIEIIAVRFPITKYYKSVFSKKIKEKKIEETDFMQLINSYGVEIWNEEDLFEDKEELFKDVHHLNDKGRDLFTSYLKNKLSNDSTRFVD